MKQYYINKANKLCSTSLNHNEIVGRAKDYDDEPQMWLGIKDKACKKLISIRNEAFYNFHNQPEYDGYSDYLYKDCERWLKEIKNM